MKVREIMTSDVVGIGPEETAEAAARMLTHYNIGMLPVCDSRGGLCGVVTDRDLVTRCMATGKPMGKTTVRQIMTGKVNTVSADMDTGVAAHMMGRLQVRRLPVVENGKLCGMVSLGDLAKQEESVMDAADALMDISGNVSAGRDW